MASLHSTETCVSHTDNNVGHDEKHAVNKPQTGEDEVEDNPDIDKTPVFKPTWSILSVFIGLCLFSFIAALDATVITTSLPTITHEIGGGGETYIWIAQCFTFSSTVPQPLYGQLANIFGRRDPFLVAILLFMLGSGVAGGAESVAMLIAGRTVQGLGAAGLNVWAEIVTCDLIPPRYRGPYLSAVLSAAGVGSTIGPVIGGALAQRNWRWIFYMNIPISGVGLVVMVSLLKVRYKRPTWAEALKRIDYVGMGIFIPSMVSLFFGLITGGTRYPWSSWRVILSLVLGVCGSMLFYIIQGTPRLCPSPSMPLKLFANRTSAAGYFIIFLAALLLQAVAYFLPLYFQAVELVSPLMSGIYFLPVSLAVIPFAGGAGWILSRWGQYIPLHYTGFACLAIGNGLLSMLNETSSTGQWIGFQILPAAGIALLFTATLPSTLAGLPESDVAVATATYSFMRSFGLVWGLAISGAVFDGQINANLSIITNERLRDVLQNGAAYAFAGDANGLKQLPAEDLYQAMSLYVKALRVVWLVAMALALFGFACVPIEKRLELKTEHDTQFGLKDKRANVSKDQV